MKTTPARIIAIVIPLLCLAIGGWAIWKQYTRLQSSSLELAQMERNLGVQKALIASISKEPEAAKQPTAPISDGEQAAFLDGLRTIARDSNVQLIRWTNISQNADANRDAPAPSGVTPIISTLEVRGLYEDVRTFLYSIAKAPRLLNFSGIRWARASDQDSSTTLSVTITRYVSPGPPPTAASGAAPKGASAEKSS